MSTPVILHVTVLHYEYHDIFNNLLKVEWWLIFKAELVLLFQATFLIVCNINLTVSSKIYSSSISLLYLAGVFKISVMNEHMLKETVIILFLASACIK